jgi:tetratricopeptide (TPR) repeat protein
VLFLAVVPAALAEEGSPLPTIRGLLGEERWQEALDAARAAHREAPDDPRVAAVLGESLLRAGRLDELDELLAPVAEKPEAPPRALITLARLRAAEGRRRECTTLLERAVEAAPGDRDVLFWAGDLAVERARAVELLERYLELSEGDAEERIESVRGTLRVFAELGDRATWVAEQSPEHLELPLTAVADVAGRTLGYVVKAGVGPKGKPVRLLLDSGAHGLFLVERMARKRGFEPLASKTIYGGGAEGRHDSKRGLFSGFVLGDLRFGSALATTTRSEFDDTGRFHGLLGMAIFGGYRVTLDLVERRLRLAPAGDEPLEGSPYWWVSGQLLVPVVSKDGERGLFVLDTGASGATVVSEEFVTRVDAARLEQATAVRAFGGLVSDARIVRGVELDFQGVTVGREGLITWDFSLQSRLGGVEVSGLLGLDALAARRIILDTVRQRGRVE